MKMVTHLFTDAGRTWRQAAQVNSKGRMIYAALQKELEGPMGGIMRDMVRANADYIKSVPEDIARQMTTHIMSRSMEGVRAPEMARELIEMYPKISDVKANLIARTETAKTATALTQSRSQLFGWDWYEWVTAEDGDRVRKSHRKMDRVLVSWNDPPSPEELVNEKPYGRYHAGCTFNCRCFSKPLVSLNEVSWPHKVYANGQIVTMTRTQFERIWKPRMAV